MPRFVVLEHDHPAGLHWDLMFQQGSVLATWSLPLPPGADHEVAAESLADHRLDYLDYEGPVSGDRGSVTRWDAGTYRVVRQTESQWVVVLSGEKLVGRVELDRLPDRPDGWRVRFALET
jgi:hypothetical protein